MNAVSSRVFLDFPREDIMKKKTRTLIGSDDSCESMSHKDLFKEIDVLLIQDGGCAPGYNPVTAFITYHLENMGREVYATTEGFKSLLDKSDNFLRLVS